MDNIPHKFDELIEGKLFPVHIYFGQDADVDSIDDSGDAEKYIKLTQGIETVQAKFRPNYRLAFPKPYNEKIQYYLVYAQNAITEYLNLVISGINQFKNPETKLYWIKETLFSVLKERIEKIGIVCDEHRYYLGNNMFRIPTWNNPQDPKETRYSTIIFNLAIIKHHLVYAFLEIQSQFSELINEEAVTHEFIINEYFKGNFKYDEPFLKKAPPEDIIVPEKNLKSFKYIHLVNDSDRISDLYESLKNKNYIHKDTRMVDFKKVFTESFISTPIIWKTHISDLYYLFHLLAVKMKLLEFPKQTHWKIVSQCFLDEHGKEYNFKRLKGLSPTIRKEEIEKIAEHLRP